MNKAIQIAALALVGLTMLGCDMLKGGEESARPDRVKPADSRPKAPVMPVEAQTPTRGPISEYLVTSSRVEAERRVEVTAEGVGECIALNVDVGDSVKKGDILAQLDTEKLETDLRQAEVQLRKLETDMNRSLELYSEGLAPKMEYDNAKASYDQQLEAVSRSRSQLRDYTVRAPLDGVVIQRNVQLGQMCSQGAPLFVIIDPESFVLSIYPHEREIARISEGQEAIVTLDSVADREFLAKVRRINPAVDPTSGAVKVMLDFAPEDRDALRESAYARVKLIMETHEDSLLVPKDAVLDENGRKYVFVVDEKTSEESEDGEETPSEMMLVANRVEIQTGLEDSANIEVIEGIDDEAMIVTLGQQNLKSGAEVRISNVAAELAANIDLTAEEALAQAAAEREAGAERGQQQIMRRRRR